MLLEWVFEHRAALWTRTASAGPSAVMNARPQGRHRSLERRYRFGESLGLSETPTASAARVTRSREMCEWFSVENKHCGNQVSEGRASV